MTKRRPSVIGWVLLTLWFACFGLLLLGWILGNGDVGKAGLACLLADFAIAIPTVFIALLKDPYV